ncbi:MAG: GNAT family N-acetyltransferase [Gemmatimonadota bacterium]|nr:GNAT family N-acetyltransferase [Gemmatimonadota bacterium]
MDRTTLGPGGAYSTRHLAPPDLPSLQALFTKAADYFELATGRPPAADEAERAFVGGPPSKTVSDKCTIGIFDATTTLVGVLDAIPDFPADGTCTIGMLLLDPAVRGRGVGTAVLSAFEAWMRAAGTGRFRTAIVAHHARGVAFALRGGYEEASRLEGYDAGDARATVVFLEKPAVGRG